MITVNEQTGVLTLPNGADWTKEAYEDFTKMFNITPIEFYELGLTEKVLEIDGFIYTIKLLDDNRVTVEREIKNETY